MAPAKPAHTLTEEERKEMLLHPSLSSLADPLTFSGVCDVNRLPECCDENDDIDNCDDVFVYKDENLVTLIPNDGTTQEEIVHAPLASPETLSMASGVSLCSPVSGVRDSLRLSLHRCAERQMDSPNEAAEIANGGMNTINIVRNGNISNLCRGDNSSQKMIETQFISKNSDIEMGHANGCDSKQKDYMVKLR